MYKFNDLKKYEYFKKMDLNYIFDSLTGVVARQYILDFARSLVSDKIPFAMAMLDLDNFKKINDEYGHKAGDECLIEIAQKLMKHVGSNGVVGRFGGDEFVIVYLKSNTYDDLHKFYSSLYEGDERCLRINTVFDGSEIFVTATTGSASFPLDANNYNELFTKMDKALYRGKVKGRNCFIIYVHEKHKDIVVNERGTSSLLSKVEDLKRIAFAAPKEFLVRRIIDYLYFTIHSYELFYVNKKNNCVFAKNKDKCKFKTDIFKEFDDKMHDTEILFLSGVDNVISKFENINQLVESEIVLALVVARVGDEGFIVLFENSVNRIWQDSDLVLLEYATTLLENRIKLGK